jgi:hypothetical protein
MGRLVYVSSPVVDVQTALSRGRAPFQSKEPGSSRTIFERLLRPVSQTQCGSARGEDPSPWLSQHQPTRRTFVQFKAGFKTT